MSSKYIINRIYLEVYNKVMIRLTIDKALKSAGITRYELAKRTGIQYQVIDKYYKNAVKRYDSYVLERICDAMNCEIKDLIEYKK